VAATSASRPSSGQREQVFRKLTTLLQQGNVPDLFQTWGGGGLRQQVEAGYVKDITADIAAWKDEINAGALSMYEVDGKNYGMPFDLGLVGFWYNTKSFADAGITTLPATWDEFLTTVQTLKSKGITPIALAGKDTWTGAFYWALHAVGTAVRPAWTRPSSAATGRSCFVKAGEQFKQLIDMEPFRRPWPPVGRRRQRRGRGGDLQHPAWASGFPAPSTPTPAANGRWAKASAGSRSRRSPAARATRSTASAEATASRSARTHRPRR
jgi:raffinose/stachyose/melibiose transport system substrate-binding protein